MRKHYIDNIRWSTVLLVIVYHVVYCFNSVGVINNVAVIGIPQMDVLLYFVYPWFMALLFVVAGMSARYSLSDRTGKEFLRQRTKSLLVPSIAGIFLLGWVTGWVTNQYVDMFGGNGDLIPGVVKYFVYCLVGMGPLWFAHELFLASLVLLLLRKIDKKEKLWELGGKVNIWILFLLVFAVWGSAQILNTPFVETYRNGIYIFMFLMGYYVFSHEKVTDILVRYKLPLLICSVIMGVGYTVYYYGENYSAHACLDSFFTNVYCWFMVLAVIGCFKAWCNRKNAFTSYMSKRNFGFYALHYPLMVFVAYVVTTYLNLPMLLNYMVVLLIVAVLLPILCEVVSRTPILRYLLLGITKKKA